MPMNLLDRPVWASLTTAHADLSLGDELARRYQPDVNTFASARDDSDAALQALARLVQPSERVHPAGTVDPGPCTDDRDQDGEGRADGGRLSRRAA